MDKIIIKLDDVEEGFLNSFTEHAYYLDLHTGQVVMVTEDDRANLEMVWEDLPPEPNVDMDLLRALLEECGLADWQVDSALEAAPVEIEYASRFRPVPGQDSREGYRDMELFIDSLGESRLADRLDRAIRGKGAFGRFREVLLDHPDQREAWFAFEGHRRKERMIAWLDTLNIAYELAE